MGLRYRVVTRICSAAAAGILIPSTANAQNAPGRFAEAVIDALSAEEMAALSLTLSLVAFAVLAAILYIRTKNQFTDYRRKSETQRAAQQARLDRAENLLSAEPQILIAWSSSAGTADVQYNADAIQGGPRNEDAILDFEQWLTGEAAQALATAIARLRERGTAFDLTLTTRAGHPVEANGRTGGGRALVRLRSASGSLRELAELRDKQSRLSREMQAVHQLFDTLDFPAWLRDEQGALSWVNQTYAQLAGAKTRDEAVAGRLEIAAVKIQDEMAQARLEGRTFHGEASLGHDNRKLALTEVATRTGAAGLALDEQASARMKAALEREATIRAEILDRIDTAVAVFDANRRLTFCNKAYRSLWQLDPAFLIMKPEFDEILEHLRADERVPTPPDGMTWRDWVASLIDNTDGEVRTTEWDLPNASLSLKLVTIPHRDGGSTHLVHNLTESLDLQTKLSAQARVQRQTLESLSEAIAVFGQDGKLKLSNPQFAAIWDLDRKDLKARPHVDDIIAACRKLYQGDDDWLALKQNVCGFMDAREPISRMIEREDEKTFELTTVPLSDGATLAVFTDITAAKEVERALRERNEALEQADQLRGNFVSNVSYHLRDPLQSIIGFAQVLSGDAMTPNEEQQREYASYILASSTSLMTIVNDILDLASIQANALELSIGDVELRDTIMTALDALKDRIGEKKVEVTIDVAPRAEHLRGDARRIRQMIFSLAANAIAFSKEGGKVGIDAFADGDMIAIRVADQGEGIPDHLKSRVFGSFETHGDGQRGPGLGLSLARGFAIKHGGEITLESEPGQGTTVTIRLPRAFEPDALPAEPAEPTEVKSEPAEMQPHG
ncbi:ATP-binding protein [Tepidamorphus sp. 3E244]|uniref:sensor histidine kinase n=1 Tax=Tepidamorphus sp. 3E244 TaxID=3385498 RepID=UPI0038FBEEB2